jgi:hypothetical protein
MSFLGNRAVNRVILHNGVQALAQQGGGVFVFVYLLKAGVPAALVLCTIAAMVAGRFLARPAVLPLARRLGLRRCLMLGTVLEAPIFPLLPQVHGPGPLLAAVVAVGALGSVIYWTCYHAYFAAIGDAARRGGQVGAREALAALVGIAAPALAGWALVAAGPRFLFGLAALVQVAAAAPLVGALEAPVPADAPGGFRAAALGAALMAGDGWFASAFYYVWQIALFITLGEGFGAYGGAMALSGLAGAAGSLLVGRMIDLGHGRRSVFVAYGCGVGVAALRAASYGTPALAIAANALGATATALLTPALMSRVYNLAKASPCTLRFHIAAEGGWDLGCGLGCLAAAGLLAAGGPMGLILLLSLAGAAAVATLLVRSY